MKRAPMLRPVLKTPPSGNLVTVDEIKANSRVEHGDDDELIGALINAAISYLDGWSGILGRCLLNQVWTWSTRCWPACPMELPFPDISAVTVTYIDPSGVAQTLDAAQYRRLEAAGGTVLEWVMGFVHPSLAVRSDAVTIEMTAGYGVDATAVPEAIRRAIILLCSTWYEHRENVSDVAMLELPFAVTALLSPFRRIAL